MSTKILFAIIYIVLDLLWISTMSTFFYKNKIEAVQMSSPMKFKIIPAIMAYITLLIVMFFICIPLSEFFKDKYPTWFVFSVVGFCIYGVYNFTNGAIFTNYDNIFMLVDTLWGILSFAILGSIFTFLQKNKIN